MRNKIVLLLNLIFTILALTAWADEKLSVLKVGPDVYSNVIVTAVTTTDIYFSSDKGMANAKLKNLEPALQKHFHFDAAKAGAVEKAQRAANLQYSLPFDIKTINRTNAQSVMDDTIVRIKAIINQPVRQLTRTPDMDVAVYQPGWFHPGAIKPDFNTVDVRATQESDYSKHSYVSSDLNPGVAFIGSELEFNSMTKYFYVDRSLPKTKLTEAEMLEINRLYRIVGKCEEELAGEQKAPDAAVETEQVVPGQSFEAIRKIPREKRALYGGAAIGALVVLVIAVRLFKNRAG